MKKRIGFLTAFVFLFCFILWHQPLQAQTFPNHPIQMVVTLAPGDTVDLAGRAIGVEMTKILKQPVIIVNKPGGGGTIGAESVVRGKKDGYTILFAINGIFYAHATDPASVPYNPLTDLDPLCAAVSVPMVLPVLADAPWKTFQDLMGYMKQNPDKVRGSTVGVNSVGSFNFEVIHLETGNDITVIPFKGGTPAVAALLGGHVETGQPTLGLIAPHVDSGKVRLLLTSQKVPEYANVPTLKQLGYKRDMNSIRFAFYLPVGVPDSIKKALVPAIEAAAKNPEVVDAVRKMGAMVDFIPGPQYQKMIADEYAMVKELMKTAPPPGAPIK
jgi:tripartite-type tricarboxylate transporter receptor subunit TctC